MLKFLLLASHALETIVNSFELCNRILWLEKLLLPPHFILLFIQFLCILRVNLKVDIA